MRTLPDYLRKGMKMILVGATQGIVPRAWDTIMPAATTSSGR